MVPIWDFPGGCPAAYARAADRDRSRRGSRGRGATMRVRPSAVACLALAAALASCSQSEETPKTRIAVGTRNLYLGTPIDPALVPPPAGQTVYDVIDELWGYVVATDFPARADALAEEIAAHRPALVGLQEVALWRTQICTPPCGDGPWNPATTVAYDFLQLLLDALQARGLAYTAAASVVNFDGEFAGASGNDYRYTDRDAIIALQGVQIANARGGNFDAAASDEVATTLPLIAVGDFNAHPPPGETRPAYGILTAPATGLSDTWVQLRPSDTGTSSYSCCRDGLLDDPAVQLYERIDLILHGPEFTPVSIDISAGNGSAPISPVQPIWASDHAGMFGVLQLD